MDLIQKFNGLPPWGKVAVLASAGVATLLYIRNVQNPPQRVESTSTGNIGYVYPEGQDEAQVFQMQEAVKDLRTEVYDAISSMRSDVVQGNNDLQTFVNDKISIFDDTYKKHDTDITELFRNTTESIISDLNEIKGNIVARENAGDMSQGTGGAPGQNHDNTIGQSKLVPLPQIKQTPKPTTTTTKPTNTTSKNVTVKSGDSLSKIASKNGVPLASVIKANPQIKDPNKIYPGQTVKVPVKK